jgi:hypothetical protein
VVFAKSCVVLEPHPEPIDTVIWLPLTLGQSQFVPSCVMISLKPTFVAAAFDGAVTDNVADAVCPGPPILREIKLVGVNTSCARHSVRMTKKYQSGHTEKPNQVIEFTQVFS